MRGASFSSWRAAGVHAQLFDEWSHYIICLLYSRPPSTFLALSVAKNNGPFVKLTKAALLQCDPLKNCFWAEQFPPREGGLVRAWECCLEPRGVPRSRKAPRESLISPPPPAPPPLTSIPLTENILYVKYITYAISVHLINESTWSNSYFIH